MRRGAVRRLHQERRLRRVRPRRPELRRPHSRRASAPRRPRRSSAPASPPTRGSRRPRPSPANGSPSPAPAASGIWPSNTPRPWACRSAPSTSTTASSRTPSGSAPISWSTPRPAIPAEAVKKETGGGAHGVLITAPSLAAFKQGVGMTRKRGTCVLVGLPPGEFPVPLFDVVANCITIRGSFVGTREDMAEALAFAAEGKVKADIELQPLSSINEDLRPARARQGGRPRGARFCWGRGPLANSNHPLKQEIGDSNRRRGATKSTFESARPALLSRWSPCSGSRSGSDARAAEVRSIKTADLADRTRTNTDAHRRRR